MNDKAYLDWLVFMRGFYKSGDLKDASNVFGYNVAQGVVKVLQQAGNDLTRANIMKQAANLEFELPMLLPGINVKTGPDDFFRIEREQLIRFNGKSWDRFGKVYGR